MTDGSLYNIAVVGGLSEARFAPLCVCCAAPATRTLGVARLFVRSDSDGPTQYVPAQIDVPVCDGCRAQHERERQPVAREVKRRLWLRWLGKVAPYLLPFGAVLAVVGLLGPRLIADLVQADAIGSLINGGTVAFLVFVAWAFVRLMRRQGDLIDVPSGSRPSWPVQVERGPLGIRYIVPVDGGTVFDAVQFGDDCSEAFEPERHLFRFRHAAVASAFSRLNAERRWSSESPRARWAQRLRWAVFGAIGVFVLYQVVLDWMA